jgi:hypothetical protein
MRLLSWLPFAGAPGGFLVAVVLAACGGTTTQPGGESDASATNDASMHPEDGGDAGDAGPCPTIASYCSVMPVPPECMSEQAKLDDMCTSAQPDLIHISATTCRGIVAVYEQGVDSSTLFYFDSSGSLIGVNHTGIGGAMCSAGGPGFVPPDGMGGGCTSTGTPSPACGDAG